jgi:hypothetical protein
MFSSKCIVDVNFPPQGIKDSLTPLIEGTIEVMKDVRRKDNVVKNLLEKAGAAKSLIEATGHALLVAVDKRQEFDIVAIDHAKISFNEKVQELRDVVTDAVGVEANHTQALKKIEDDASVLNEDLEEKKVVEDEAKVQLKEAEKAVKCHAVGDFGVTIGFVIVDVVGMVFRMMDL